jgi:hypothetical protein
MNLDAVERAALLDFLEKQTNSAILNDTTFSIPYKLVDVPVIPNSHSAVIFHKVGDHG